MPVYGANYSYGNSPYYKDDGIYNANNLLHYYALKKLFPIKDMTGQFDNDLKIEGQYLDDTFYQGNNLENEVFPDTATDVFMTQGFCRVMDSTSIQEALAGYPTITNKNRRMNPGMLISDASKFGFHNTTIIEGVDTMFIVDTDSAIATHLSAPLFSTDTVYTFYVDSTGSADMTNSLKNFINSEAPAFTLPIYNLST